MGYPPDQRIIVPPPLPLKHFAFTLVYKMPQKSSWYWWGVELEPKNPLVFIFRSEKIELTTTKKTYISA